MSVTSFRLQDDLAELLERNAKEQDRSKGWVINEALRLYFASQALEKQRWQETMDALDSIKSGDLVDEEQVDNWLQSWGQDSEKQTPSP
uniref:Ribbon-helix-helix protein CopG domain-containing protein n=1 Tax=Magnetococcus massalia (strain MO-1) TaxID=451514 RepID=A0A1S7LKI3_MAGMO|nr:conserved protein of unknown function [Candidatus Magnetococcus massalia]